MSKIKREGAEKLARLLDTGIGKVHISGVFGVSASALAAMLRERGIFTSGSDDAKCGDIGAELACRGVRIAADREAARSMIMGADALVYSSAISPEHPDRLAAAEWGIPEYSRAELLGVLMKKYRRRIGISGTHGKSTTTAMLGDIFSVAGLSPTVLCGARLSGGRCFKLGADDYLIYEACEYRDSFLHFSPSCAIITNVELEHTDYFPSLSAIEKSFIRSASGADIAVVSADSPSSLSVANALGARAVTVGKSPDARIRYERSSASSFRLLEGGKMLAEFNTGVYGEHNISNAALAATAAIFEGVGIMDISSALSSFHGIEKRLERIGEGEGVSVYRDYAHHPTEIRAALTALRECHGSVAVLFRPHTYTRTRDLWSGFVGALSMADRIGIYEIYPARECAIPGISAEALAAEIKGAVPLSRDSALDFICESGCDAVVLMGAGDLDWLTEKVKLKYGDIK